MKRRRSASRALLPRVSRAAPPWCASSCSANGGLEGSPPPSPPSRRSFVASAALACGASSGASPCPSTFSLSSAPLRRARLHLKRDGPALLSGFAAALVRVGGGSPDSATVGIGERLPPGEDGPAAEAEEAGRSGSGADWRCVVCDANLSARHCTCPCNCFSSALKSHRSLSSASTLAPTSARRRCARRCQRAAAKNPEEDPTPAPNSGRGTLVGSGATGLSWRDTVDLHATKLPGPTMPGAMSSGDMLRSNTVAGELQLVTVSRRSGGGCLSPLREGRRRACRPPSMPAPPAPTPLPLVRGAPSSSPCSLSLTERLPELPLPPASCWDVDASTSSSSSSSRKQGQKEIEREGRVASQVSLLDSGASSSARGAGEGSVDSGTGRGHWKTGGSKRGSTGSSSLLPDGRTCCAPPPPHDGGDVVELARGRAGKAWSSEGDGKVQEAAQDTATKTGI